MGGFRLLHLPRKAEAGRELPSPIREEAAYETHWHPIAPLVEPLQMQNTYFRMPITTRQASKCFVFSECLCPFFGDGVSSSGVHHLSGISANPACTTSAAATAFDSGEDAEKEKTYAYVVDLTFHYFVKGEYEDSQGENEELTASRKTWSMRKPGSAVLIIVVSSHSKWVLSTTEKVSHIKYGWSTWNTSTCLHK